MFSLHTGNFRYDLKTLEEAFAGARTTTTTARVVDSDGVHMRAEYFFENGALVRFRYNIGGRMVEMTEVPS